MGKTPQVTLTAPPTKEEFITAARNGWKTKPFSPWYFEGGAVCSVGAAAVGLGIPVGELINILGWSLVNKISMATFAGELGGKDTAIAEIEKIKWPEAQT